MESNKVEILSVEVVNDFEVEVVVNTEVGEEIFLFNSAEGYSRVELKVTDRSLYTQIGPDLKKTTGIFANHSFEDYGHAVSSEYPVVVRDDNCKITVGEYVLTLSMGKNREVNKVQISNEKDDIPVLLPKSKWYNNL